MTDIHQVAKPNPPREPSLPPTARSSYAESHDGVDNIVVILPQGLDGLLAGHASLCHNQINILSLEAGLVNLLAIILLVVLLGIGLGSLALENLVLVVVASVVTGSLGGSQLLSGRGLGLGVQVLDLGLTEDTRKRKKSQLDPSCMRMGQDGTYIQVLLLGER